MITQECIPDWLEEQLQKLERGLKEPYLETKLSKLDVHFSSEKHDWETPDELFQLYNKVWRFTRDVCATAENTKCKRFWTPEDDCLIQKWSGKCWMNPPYGRVISKFVAKAALEAQLDRAMTVCLLPARTDTRWFHEHIWDHLRDRTYEKVSLQFLPGRLKFKGAPHPAPFPSMVVTFKR